ncbi:hypothetical protein LTR93_011304 [Exophiala xenobiotica]|nr:hypothetical protein LTR93_011304 [Exophiala xenobiotica]
MASLNDTYKLWLEDSDTLEDTVRLEDYPQISTNALRPNPSVLLSTNPDFARLVPVNDQAKLAFHEIALILNADPGWNSHCRKFIHVSDVKDKVASGGLQESDTSECDPEVQEVFTGYFCLNLTILPENFPRGWIIGSGRPNMDHLGVDFLITMKGKRDGVRGRHAHIRHHNVNRLLMMAPAYGKKVWLNGEEVSNEGRLLESTRMGVTIGNLVFRLEFLLKNTDTYNKQLDEIIRESGSWFTEKIEAIDSTPSDNHLILQGYQIHTLQAFGAFGVRTQSSFSQVNEEVTILRRLEKHPHVCALTEVIYSDGDHTSMGNRSINDVYIILDPWAPQTFCALLAPQADHQTRSKAFHQGAQGIRYIHRCGIIHRDIKLTNLLVARRNPLRIVVADFGHATTDAHSRDHMKGTISYLPPEIVQLKELEESRRRSEVPKSYSWDPTLHWSQACDVYTYGLVGYELLIGSLKRPVHGVDKALHKQLLTTLQELRTALAEVLLRMLAWAPELRPEMREVLLSPCWSDAETLFVATKRHFT